MILLDTNVLSEVMRTKPNRRVIAWLNAQPPESIWTTAVTVFEIRQGIASLPAGKRKRTVAAAFDALLNEDLAGRVIALDTPAAKAAADIAAKLRDARRPIDFRDVLIAGCCLARRAKLATRDVKHFADTGVKLVDPWAVDA